MRQGSMRFVQIGLVVLLVLGAFVPPVHEVAADDVTVQPLNLEAALAQHGDKLLSQRCLARAREPSEPKSESFLFRHSIFLLSMCSGGGAIWRPATAMLGHSGAV